METGSHTDHKTQTLSGCPYFFTANGQLRNKVTGEPYVSRVNCRDVQSTQQEHTAICSIIANHVRSLLESQLQLQKVLLPQGEGFVYMTPRALYNKKALLVLIPDAGTVPCGVWSWRTVVRDGLNYGCQVPYVLWAMGENWGVLLMNPNEGRGTPEEHVSRVWDRHISQVKKKMYLCMFTSLAPFIKGGN